MPDIVLIRGLDSYSSKVFIRRLRLISSRLLEVLWFIKREEKG